MAEMWKPHPREVYQEWVDAITMEASDKLSDWETSFIDSVGNQLANGHGLSQKQAEILEKIYASKTK